MRLFSRTRLPQVDRDFVLAPMSRPPFHRIRLDRCPKGIDGVHIDVALDVQLVNATALFVKRILRHNTELLIWKQKSKAPEAELVSNFQKAYIEHSRIVLQQVRRSARPDLAQLFQLAVVRLLLVMVDKQYHFFRQELQDARAQPSRQHGGNSLELHDRAVALARNEESIRFRAFQDVMRVVLRIEDSYLRKLRATVLGISWPVSRSMLVNPIVHMGGLGSSEDFFRLYPHILRDAGHAKQLYDSLFEVLSDWVPDELVLVPNASAREARSGAPAGYALRAQIAIQPHVSQLIEAGELAHMIPHEFDNAADVLDLLGGDSGLWPEAGRWEKANFAEVQRAKVQEWMSLVERAGLMAGIRASTRLADVYPRLALRGGAEWVYGYLAGECSARELSQRLQTLPGVEDARAIVHRIDERVRAVAEKNPPNAEQRAAVRFIHDMLRFRYDLKLASWMFEAMSSMRLLHQEQKLSMSASNGLLQDFRYGRVDTGRIVIGHVVLKADVRGSTDITAQMQARNLNPATYFSRTLYDPITQLLKLFGAEKVFVEGDAVILSLLEYGGIEVEQMAVARACGLAIRILQVVEAKNVESRKLNLPELGLGIGIAYASAAPTYLYDEQQKIMISPAINRADRLSSCHWELRRLLSEEGYRGRRVVVAHPVQKLAGYGKSDPEGLIHYNVNGIELGSGAFEQLSGELQLELVQLSAERNDAAEVYHVGRYLDIRENTHWVVVRESPVLLWMGDRLVEAERNERVYYEVVSDPELIKRVTQQFGERS